MAKTDARKTRLQEVKNSFEKFAIAYSILESEVYIPEKYREGYIRFSKKLGKVSSAPTKLKLLQFKIEIDSLLEELTEKIYSKINLE